MPRRARAGVPAGDLSSAALAELNDLLWALPATLDPYEIIAAFLEKGARLFDAPLACLWLMSEEGPELAGCYGFTDKKAEQLWDSLDLEARPATDLQLDSADLNALASFGKRRLGALLVLPLSHEGRIRGWLALARLDPRPFSEIERQFVAMIVARVAVAIENARRYQETESRSRELELLYEIAQLLVSTVRLQELLDRLARRMVETFQLSGCLIGMVDPETGEVPPRALYMADPEANTRLSAHFEAHPLRIDVGRTSQVLARAEPFLSRNLIDDPLVFPALKEVLGPGSLIAAPLMVRDRAVGVLYWFRQGKQRPLTRAMLPLISHLANQAAIALDNAQLVSHMEQQIAARTASVVADKEALAMQLAEDRQAVSHLAEEVRRQTHNIIGLAGVV
ncbi:MAG: GAF domain-containing protein, partial [Candidatus Sericytochromatia bacterium]